VELNLNNTLNNDNRMLTAGSITLGYDNNGNLTTKTVGSDTTNYTWDYNNMLTQVTTGGNSYAYRYDGLLNRVARIGNSVETRYVSGLAETDVSGNITAYYVYGLGLISKITPSDQVYYYHYDGIGSTIGMSDSNGNMVNKYAYDEFGKVLNQEEAIPNPFKYVGQFGVMDEENGLFYMRARYYDPEVGRFISKDPIGLLGGLNMFTYVGNNPVNLIDPEGKFVFLLLAPPVYTGAMALADLAIIGGLWWTSQQVLKSQADLVPNACEFSKGLGDKYGPLLKAPGMPGWEAPTGDFNKDGPVDYWKKPSDWDKKTTWEKIKWYIGKIGGALVSGI